MRARAAAALATALAAAPAGAQGGGRAAPPREVSRAEARRPTPRADAAALVRQADRAYDAGEADEAARLYAAALAADSAQSRALYRLAELRPGRAESVALLRRYVRLQRGDAWGWVALAGAETRAGRHAAALAALDTAERVRPGERDVRLARAGVLAAADRPDDAAALLAAWTAAHPRDAQAWAELGRAQRRAGVPRAAARSLARAQALAPDARTAAQLRAARLAAAPAAEPSVLLGRDSDGNATRAGTVAADAWVADRLRLGATGARRAVVDGAADVAVTQGALRAQWRPSARTTVEGEAGASWVGGAGDPAAAAATAPPGRGSSGRPGATSTGRPQPTATAGASGAAAVPTGRLRLRWRAPATASLVEVRLSHALLDATPLLVTNRVTRTEGAATVERAVAGPLRLRALARVAALDDALGGAANVRTVLGGGPVLAGGAGWQLGVLGSRLAYRRPSNGAGYAAPRAVDGVELGLYLERETLGALPVRLVLDAGAGAQRVVEHGAAAGDARWGPAGRVWGELAVPLGRRVEALAEVDAYRSRLAEAASSAEWQSGSVRLGVRVR